MHVNAAKYLWILLCTLGFKLDGDILDCLAALLKDMDYIVPRTAPQADQHQLHGTRSRTASLRAESRSKHDLMPAPGLADERAVFNPFDACLHRSHPESPIIMCPNYGASRLAETNRCRGCFVHVVHCSCSVECSVAA